MLLHGGNTLIIRMCDILLEGTGMVGSGREGRREGLGGGKFERTGNGWNTSACMGVWKGGGGGGGGILYAVSVSAHYISCSQVV